MELTAKQKIACEVKEYLDANPEAKVKDVCARRGINISMYYHTLQRLKANRPKKPRAPKQLPLERAIAKAGAGPVVDFSRPATIVMEDEVPPPRPNNASMLAGKTIVLITDTKDLASSLANLFTQGHK